MPSRFRVPAGWLLAVVVALLAQPTAASLFPALPLVVAGEALRVWASGHIEKTRRLATGGPYAHSRNPLYGGSLLIGLGLAVACASLWVVLAVAVYFAAFYPTVMREEAAFLRSKFADEYARWARSVPLFLPRLTPGGPRASHFDWGRVRANREWRTALALPFAASGLVALPHLRRLLGL